MDQCRYPRGRDGKGPGIPGRVVSFCPWSQMRPSGAAFDTRHPTEPPRSGKNICRLAGCTSQEASDTVMAQALKRT